MDKICLECGNTFPTPYIKQVVCGENCRVNRKLAQKKRLKTEEYREEKLKLYLDNIKKYDKHLGEWQEANPITVLPGGDISIFGKPSMSKKATEPVV
jgi:hypothetical protein